MSTLTNATTRFKLSLFSTQRQLEEQRLYIEDRQIREFWENRSLLEMQQILTIKQEKVIEYVWNYVSYYLQNKKNSNIKNAYCIKEREKNKQGGEVLMWFYDCKIFKTPAFSRQDNQMLSSFIIRYKDVSTQLPHHQGSTDEEGVFEFINPNLMSECATVLKCKQSCLLKIYQLFKEINLDPINGDVAILTEDLYYKFICHWAHFAQSWDPEPLVRHLFRGLMILMQNQIILQFSKTLSEKQKQIRRYEKPVAIFQKPKLKQTYTMVEEGVGDVEWYSLKISAFKFKYKVAEDEKKYVCYRVKQSDSFDVSIHQKLLELDEEDQKIIMAFDKIKPIPLIQY